MFMQSPQASAARPKAPLPALVAAFVVIYVVWGSTYLGIRFAVETIPPFFMGGSRFLLAGLVLMGYLLAVRRESVPAGRQWREAGIVGILLLAGGNGLVSWAEERVPSNIAALIVGTTPLWFVLLHWLLYRGPRPNARLLLGLVAGFAGVGVLVFFGGETPAPEGPTTVTDSDTNTSLGRVPFLLLACAVWAYGSLRSKHVDQGPSVFMASAMQMIVGGAAMLLIATFRGEWPLLLERDISERSIWAWVYLTTVGSLLAFSTYAWLLTVASPAAVATYAYVNPVVAVFLGWWLADEPVAMGTLAAGALIVGAVALMTIKPKAQPAPNEPTAAD